MIELILSHPASYYAIHDRVGFDGTMAMHIVAALSNFHFCQRFIENGANVNCRDILGRTPLMEAADNGLLDVIKLFTKQHKAIQTSCILCNILLSNSDIQ